MKKVVVGISGGVDSAVTALLLKEQGYEVTGVTMILTDKTNIEDAKKICDVLKIHHIILDLRKEFKELVIEKFISECNMGLTPNPCVLCDKYFKFGLMFDRLFELNYDYMATGHYVNIIDGCIAKGKDQEKDQSYFLAMVTKKQLEKVLFPLGNYTKEEVRKIAKENNLFLSNKKGSTGACFIGEGEYKKFIYDNFSNKTGAVINIDTNNKIGTHEGLMFYTIGQRRGIDIGGTKDRLFVAGKNTKENILYVCEGEKNPYLYSNNCIINDLTINVDALPKSCNAKFRYRSQLIEVSLNKINNDEIQVIYKTAKSVTPGQLCVLYLDDLCIGSGTIKEVRNENKKLWYLL